MMEDFFLDDGPQYHKALILRKDTFNNYIERIHTPGNSLIPSKSTKPKVVRLELTISL